MNPRFVLPINRIELDSYVAVAVNLQLDHVIQQEGLYFPMLGHNPYG